MRNFKPMLTTVFAGTLLLGVSYSLAHGGVDHGQGEAHSDNPTNIQAAQPNAPISLHSMFAQIDSVDKDLAAGKMEGIHGYSETINRVIKDLDKVSTLDDKHKKRVHGYLKNILKITNAMHESADEKNLEVTKKRAKKLRDQAELLQKQFGNSETTGSIPAK